MKLTTQGAVQLTLDIKAAVDNMAHEMKHEEDRNLLVAQIMRLVASSISREGSIEREAFNWKPSTMES